jgi:predicted alpha/beta hydrolase family esterase
MNYLLIPGNPPAVHFYEEWKNEIELSQKDFIARVSSYGPLTKHHSISSKLDEMINHHHEQLEKFHQQVFKPVTIIGHSLGGFVALKLLEKSPAMVKEVILLHPFLRQPDLKGRFILKIVATLSNIDFIPKTLVKNRNVLEWFSRELPFVTNEEMYLSFEIAHFESKSIMKDISPISFTHIDKTKIKMFYCDKDIWCPMRVVNELRSQIHSTECLEPHGFITEKKHRESLWQKIIKE